MIWSLLGPYFRSCDLIAADDLKISDHTNLCSLQTQFLQLFYAQGAIKASLQMGLPNQTLRHLMSCDDLSKAIIDR